MAKEVNLLNTLVSKATDHKLANTDNLYDKIQTLMQEAINNALAKYFNFQADGTPRSNTLDGRVLLEGSVGADSLDPNLKNTLGASDTSTIDTLNRDMWSVVSSLAELTERIENLEDNVNENPNFGRTEFDGFFIVDDNMNVGACVLPDGSCYGWDGEAREGETALTLVKLNGGTYVVIHGADYSEMNIGNLDENVAVRYIYLDNLTFNAANRTFTLTAIPTNADPEEETPIYTGGYNWTCYGYSHLISLSPAGQHGATATFSYTEAAEGQSVTVRCRAAVNGVETTKTFAIPAAEGVAVESIDVKLENGTLSNYVNDTRPFYGSSVTFMPVVYPANAKSIEYYKCEWNIGDEYNPQIDDAWVPTSNYKKTIPISSSTTEPLLIEVRFHGKYADGTEISSDNSVWRSIYVCHHAPVDNPNLTGLGMNNYSTDITTKDTQLSVDPLPADAEFNQATVEWMMETDNATVDNTGKVTLLPTIERNEQVVVTARTANPDYDSSIPASDENPQYFKASAIMTNRYEPELESLEIVSTSSKCKNFYYKGQTVSFDAVPTPYLDKYRTVTWSIRSLLKGGASVDNYGNVSISNLADGKGPFIAILTATGRNHVTATVTLTLEYENENTHQRTVRKIWPIANVGGTYVDFFAQGTTGNGRDKTVNVDANVTWEVVTTMTASEADTTISSGISGGQAPPSAAAAVLMPVNGIEQPVAVDLSNTEMTYTTADVDALFTQPNSGISGPAKGPAKGPTRSGNSADFGDGSDTDHPLNRLFLDSTVEGPQVVTVKCTYSDGNGFSTYYIQQYAFTYDATKEPVTKLYMHKTNFVGTPGLNAAGGLAGWFKLAKDWIKPYPLGSSKTEDDFVFDYHRINVAHTDGQYESTYSKMANGYGYADGCKMHVIEDTTNASESWYITYALEGEEYYWLDNNRQNLTIEAAGGNPNYYYPLLRYTEPVTVSLSCPAGPVTATSITITGPDQIDGIALGAVEGQPIFDVAFGCKESGTNRDLTEYTRFCVYGSQEYCTMNTLGNKIWLHSTGGQWKTIEIMAYVSENLSTTKSIQVRMS